MRLVGEPSPEIDHGIHARSRLRHPRRPSLGPQPLDLLLRCLRTTTVAGSLRLSICHEAGELVGGSTGLGMRVGACGREAGCVCGGSGHGLMFFFFFFFWLVCRKERRGGGVYGGVLRHGTHRVNWEGELEHSI